MKTAIFYLVLLAVFCSEGVTVNASASETSSKKSKTTKKTETFTKDVLVNAPIAYFDAKAAGENFSGFKYYRTFGVDFKKPKKDGLYQYVDDKLVDDFIKYTNDHKIEVIWTLYVTTRTLEQELEYVKSLIKKKMNIVAFEYGGEFYLPKYARVDKSKKGVVEKVTPEIYVEMLGEWLPAFLKILPFKKGDHIIIGASHGNKKTRQDQHRQNWNVEVVKGLKKEFPKYMDKLSWSFHLYKGENPKYPKNGEEEIVDKPDFTFMEDWPSEMKIFVTESGYYVNKFSEEQLDLAEQFWIELYKALRPGDVYGIHTLVNKGKKPNPLALIDRNGDLTPVGKRFKEWLPKRGEGTDEKAEKKSSD